MICAFCISLKKAKHPERGRVLRVPDYYVY
jgi:hypothetical protein